MKNATIPIIIGVTGHRDLLAPEKIFDRCRIFFADLQKNFPDSPLYVISSLAEGADQICADAALASGAEIWGIIPFEEKAYLETFQTEAGKKKYLHLKSQAAHIVEINESPDSPEKYVKAGKFIVEHCNMLLAIWDGCDSKRPGGTRHIIDLALNKCKYDPAMLAVECPVVPVIHLFAQRHRQSDSFILQNKPEDGELFIGTTLESMQKIDKLENQQLMQQMMLLNNFNRVAVLDFRKKNMNIPEDIEKEYELSQWLDRYTVSSRMATMFQNKYNRQLKLLYLGGILGGICVQIYGGIDLERYQWGHYFLFGYLLLWGLMYCYWKFSHKSFHFKYLELRLMTQLLKNFIYLKLLGCSEQFWEKFSSQFSNNSVVIISALRYWSVLPDKKCAMTPETKSLIQEIWINEQIDYFSKKLTSTQKKIKSKVKIHYILTFLAIIIPIYFLCDFYLVSSGAVYDWLRSVNGLLVALPLFILAMIQFYYNQKNIEKTEKQFQEMLDNYIYIRDIFSMIDDAILQQKVLSLSNASMKEITSWINIYVDSHPEVIKS